MVSHSNPQDVLGNPQESADGSQSSDQAQWIQLQLSKRMEQKGAVQPMLIRRAVQCPLRQDELSVGRPHHVVDWLQTQDPSLGERGGRGTAGKSKDTAGSTSWGSLLRGHKVILRSGPNNMS